MFLLELSNFVRLILFTILYLTFIINLYVIIGSALLHTEPIKRFFLAFLAVFDVMQLWMLCAVTQNVTENRYIIFESVVNYFPVALFIIIMVIIVFGTIVLTVDQIIYRKTNVSLSSIKESIDTLDKGIVIFDDIGSIFMSNRVMIDLCYILTNKGLVNGKIFENDLKEFNFQLGNIVISYDKEIIVKVRNGLIFQFLTDTVEYRKLTLNRIIATNITDEYNLNLEIEESINRQKLYNEELKRYNNNVIEYTKNEELLKAKIRIHDDLGELLLQTRRIDENSSIEERKIVLDSWNNTFALFKNNEYITTAPTNELDDLLVAAKNIGVKIYIDGDIPKNKIIYTMIHECLTNTVKHGNGDEMYIKSYVKNDKHVVECSNNGEVPKDFRFKGGLKSLEEMVNRSNGKIYANLTDKFTLIIEL